MINIMEVTETNKMVEKENLDVRTITMGINLLDCAGPDLAEVNEKIYNKITTLAKDLVSTGEEIAKEFGVPIVNKRISITPISLVGSSACKTPEDYVTIAKTLDKAAHTLCTLNRFLYKSLILRMPLFPLVHPCQAVCQVPCQAVPLPYNRYIRQPLLLCSKSLPGSHRVRR